MPIQPRSSQHKKDEEKPLPFLYSRSIKNLAKNNFNQFLGTKDTAALVMFYQPDCVYCQSAKPHFLKAAKTTTLKNRLYGAVDCTQEDQLCEMENVKAFPTFKLYVGGKFLAKYNQSPHFVNMKNFMENAPVDTHVDTGHTRGDVIFITTGGKTKSQKKIAEEPQ